MTKDKSLIPYESIENKILIIRGQQVILDIHLAELFEVSPSKLNQSVQRNIDRFPPDFMFKLNFREAALSRSQFATLKRGTNIKYLPHAFTEHGAIMAANVLRSKHAVKASIYVVRAFVKMKELISSHKELAAKIDELERNVATHDKAIVSLFDAIRKLMTPPPEKRKIDRVYSEIEIRERLSVIRDQISQSGSEL